MLVSHIREGTSGPTALSQVILTTGQCRAAADRASVPREQIGALLEAENLTVGAELGVQEGLFAAQTLSQWPACRRYYLVDLWRPQENYEERANVPLAQQERHLRNARRRLRPFNDTVVFLRMSTSEAANHIPDESLDYVYIDARHDYCGVSEDLRNYWPKVRPGGIFAGHDFYFANHSILGKDDWALCQNGERHLEAVRGAVLEFARGRSLSICVTQEFYPTWLIRKPLAGAMPKPGCMDPDVAATYEEYSPIFLRRVKKRRSSQEAAVSSSSPAALPGDPGPSTPTR
eukprot:EG_transcript_18523